MPQHLFRSSVVAGQVSIRLLVVQYFESGALTVCTVILGFILSFLYSLFIH